MSSKHRWLTCNPAKFPSPLTIRNQRQFGVSLCRQAPHYRAQLESARFVRESPSIQAHSLTHSNLLRLPQHHYLHANDVKYHVVVRYISPTLQWLLHVLCYWRRNVVYRLHERRASLRTLEFLIPRFHLSDAWVQNDNTVGSRIHSVEANGFEVKLCRSILGDLAFLQSI